LRIPVMFSKFRPAVFFTLAAFIAFFGILGGCSKEYHKADADKEVYKIIDGKWRESFGQKANYIISDSPLSPNDVPVEEIVSSSKVLTLAEAVAIATKYNRDYQSQKEQLYLTALDLTLIRHRYARQWFGTIDAKYASGIDSSGERFEDVSIDSGEQGFGFDYTRLLGNGIQIGTGLAIEWARFLAGDPRATLVSVLSSSIAVPLLGGGAGKVAFENLTQAERNALYEIRSFNRYRKNFVVGIVNDYYRVLQQSDRVTNALNSYKSKVLSKKRLEMEAEFGRKAHFDVDEAEQSELNAQDNYIRAQQTYQQQLDRFKIKLSLPTDIDIQLDKNELDALEEIGISEPDFTQGLAIETALLRRLDLANTRDQIDDSVRKVKLAADSLGTELNLVGSARVDSKPETEVANLQFYNGSYGFGFEADLPFDRKAERNAYRESLVTLQQRQRDYDERMEEVKFDVRQAYRELDEAAEKYRIQKISLDLAQKRVENNEMLLEIGRGTTRLMLESQDALLQAQNSVTEALIEHTIAKLTFFRDTGILQVRPDGMWEQTVK